jgi:hypothetical protein
MKNELSKILESIPRLVRNDIIVDFKGLDVRISAVSVLFANTIGVDENHIEFCPENEPPLKEEEELSWIWSFRPDLADEFLSIDLSDDLRILIESYRDCQMERFWNHIT